ncbi:membrane-bound alkaline phosphatase-like [Ochlerotatus camptorhynchus]|uniref:membrane-bound alkaline phosphatase-like n=1 Tax=Ochlerotatus camptorhynchus TaxID=644619 RepID=UPI0031E04374
MKTSLALVAICGILTTAAIPRRTYDNDHQHKRSSPDDPNQHVGYQEIETTSEFWRQAARNTIASKLTESPVVSKPKNVVFFIGDGMSPQTVAATRMYLGNENKMLPFEEFVNLATTRTYCIDKQVADSACTATALLSGVKTNYGMVNKASEIPFNSCGSGAQIEGLLKWAQDNGMMTGLVSTARVTDSTAAAAYASVTNDNWEDDSYVRASGCDPASNPDIAQQLIHGEVGRNLNVILGGGRRHFIPSTDRDEEGSYGSRTDGRNLINEWKQLHPDGEFIWNRTALTSVRFSQTERLLGLFESSHLMYHLEVLEQGVQMTEPNLPDMVAIALRMMDRHEGGFFLLVEGGRIDTAHHETRPRLALEETAEFSRAVDLVRSMTREDDTLIVVTADHGHTMTYNGYASRGSDVLGIAGLSDEDGLPYATLSYANGPGYYGTYKEENRGERVDITGMDFKNFRTQYPATVPLDESTHGGEDVVVYARGPMAHLFRGNMEQSAVPHLIAYATQMGRFKV